MPPSSNQEIPQMKGNSYSGVAVIPRRRCTPSNGNISCIPTFTGPGTRFDVG